MIYRQKKLFFAVFSLVMLIALVLGIVIPTAMGWPLDFSEMDQDGYYAISRALASGHGFQFHAEGEPVMHRAPLYPFLLAPFQTLPDSAVRVAILGLHSALVAVAAVMIWAISRSIFQSRAVGLLAIALVLINPWLYRLVVAVHPALLSLALYLVFAWCVLQLLLREKVQTNPTEFKRIALMLGLSGGLLSLAHGSGIATFALLGAAVWAVVAMRVYRRQEKLKQLASLTLGLLLGVTLIVPWTLRNLSVTGLATPVTTGASFNYFMGNVYWGVGGHVYDHAQIPVDNALIAAGAGSLRAADLAHWGLMDPTTEAEIASRAKLHALDNPLTVLQKSALSLADMVFPVTHLLWCQTRPDAPCGNHSAKASAIRSAQTLYSVTLLVLLVFGMRQRPRERKASYLLVAVSLVHFAPFLPLGQWAPHGIYSLNALVLLSVGAGAGALSVLRLGHANLLSHALKTARAEPAADNTGLRPVPNALNTAPVNDPDVDYPVSSARK